MGLNDSLLLDQKAEQVAPLIAEVETAISIGEMADVTKTLIVIASEFFQIPTFTPDDGLPEGWQRIMGQWLNGVLLQLIFADCDSNLQTIKHIAKQRTLSKTV